MHDSIDTNTAAERLQLHLFAALAEFERERGRIGGSPSMLSARKLKAALAMRESGEMAMSEIAAEPKVGKATLYRHLARHRDQAAGLRLASR